VEGHLAIVGTNFGQARTPGWYHNLRADPAAQVLYRGRTAAARAREAEGSERAQVLSRAEGIYGGFGEYQERIDDREVHVMVLEAV
jgi:deazaflavin-dependent oxidoreductase (nitroreductase family)